MSESKQKNEAETAFLGIIAMVALLMVLVSPVVIAFQAGIIPGWIVIFAEGILLAKMIKEIDKENK